MTGPDSEVRVLRSPYWAVGWAFVVFAVVLTPVFLVAIDWSNWSLTFGDVLNLAKVPITSLIIGSIGLSVARPKIVSTDRDVRVVNFVRSTTLTWDQVAGFDRTKDGVVRIRSASGQAFPLEALSSLRMRRLRGWRARALKDLEGMLAARRQDAHYLQTHDE